MNLPYKWVVLSHVQYFDWDKACNSVPDLGATRHNFLGRSSPPTPMVSQPTMVPDVEQRQFLEWVLRVCQKERIRWSLVMTECFSIPLPSAYWLLQLRTSVFALFILGKCFATISQPKLMLISWRQVLHCKECLFWWSSISIVGTTSALLQCWLFNEWQRL